MFALIDGNCFYASCERIFNPALNRLAVVVLSNNDGCVITRTAEAKALGIKMGEPYFKIKHFVAQKKLIVFSSNYELYGDISRRMMNSIASLVPQIEVYSIDECFADLTGMANYEPLSQLGVAIRLRVLQWVGIPTCVGIAPTKTLAKFCNHLAKRHGCFNGVVNWCEWSPSVQMRAMQSEEVGALWGVGRRISKKLNALGMFTVFDLFKADGRFIQQHFGVTLLRTHKELHGQACIMLEQAPAPKQQMIRSRSFSKKLTQIEDIQAAVTHHVCDATQSLRKQGSVANIIGVFLQTNPHAVDEVPYYCHKTITLPIGTADTLTINNAAQGLLKQCFVAGKQYKKCGVSLEGIENADVQQQTDMFALADSSERTSLMTCLDKTNSRFGKGALRLGSEYQSNHWQMQREKLSPCYTTQFADLLLVS